MTTKHTDEIIFGDPGNNLPKHVRMEAEERGYTDANESLSLLVTPADIDVAFAEAAHGNGNACVMAQAGRRLGASWVYFYRMYAWVDLGSGPLLRFRTSREIYEKVIKPFDQYDREATLPGLYHLLPPHKSQRLAARRVQVAASREKMKTQGVTEAERAKRDKKITKAYLGRVVMGAQA